MIQVNDTLTANSATGDALVLQAVRQIETLQMRLKHCTAPPGALADILAHVRMVLKALPMSADELALAGICLRDAARYLKSDERGAAGYELQLLAHQLTRCVSKLPLTSD